MTYIASPGAPSRKTSAPGASWRASAAQVSASSRASSRLPRRPHLRSEARRSVMQSNLAPEKLADGQLSVAPQRAHDRGAVHAREDRIAERDGQGQGHEA